MRKMFTIQMLFTVLTLTIEAHASGYCCEGLSFPEDVPLSTPGDGPPIVFTKIETAYWCGQAEDEQDAAGEAYWDWYWQCVEHPDNCIVVDLDTITCEWDAIGGLFDDPIVEFVCAEEAVVAIPPAPPIAIKVHPEIVWARAYTAIPGQSAADQYSDKHFARYGTLPGVHGPWKCERTGKGPL